MITTQIPFLEMLGAPAVRFVIPVYQRVYTWTNRQCDALLNDAMRAGRTGRAHFLGTLLISEEGEGETQEAIFDIIDGQQRCATMTILLAALRERLEEAPACSVPDAAHRIAETFLFSSREPDRPKLLLGRADRATLQAVLDRSEPPSPDDASQNVFDAYTRFKARISELSDVEVQGLWKGLCALYIVKAQLSEGDRPQLIFESLNSRGLPLTAADLVRNLILANIEHDEQTRLFETYWEPIEALYADDIEGTRLTAAIHGWLAASAPKIHVGGKDDVYPAFKEYLETTNPGSIEELLIGLSGFCRTFAARTRGSGQGRALAHDSWGDSIARGIISEKKLFGD